jgi:hypothetical protein
MFFFSYGYKDLGGFADQNILGEHFSFPPCVYVKSVQKSPISCFPTILTAHEFEIREFSDQD